ncbi:MAG TPA: TetR/AcrR family transcriptional regulator [Phenylobacterium sp.]
MDAAASKKPPGRPRNFDPAAALESAMLLFWRHGYEGATIAQLTRAMGVKSASLYAAFGSKAQLYREALAHYLQGAGRIGFCSLSAAPTAREGIGRILQQAAVAFTLPEHPPGCMIGIGALRCGVENQIAAEETAVLRRMSEEVILHRLEQAKAEGELSPATDPVALAAYFGAILQGLSVQAQDGAGRERLLQIAELAMKAWPGSD